MAQFYKITKAFQSKDKETGEPTTDAHGNSRWMFQVEGQGPEGWMSVNKKEGSELSPGDYVYGIVDTWPEGKAKFVRQQVPEGTPYPAGGSSKPAQTAAPQAPAAQGGDISKKLDYIIGLLENKAQFPSNGPAPAQTGDVSPADIDGTVDFSGIDY